MPDDLGESLPAGLPPVLGRYTLLRALGAGAMGRVYLGQDQDGTRAAVKVLKTDDTDSWRFDREVAVLSGDFGDAVAKYYDADLEAALIGHVTHLDGLPRLAAAPDYGEWLDQARTQALLDHAIDLWRRKDRMFRDCNG